MTDRVQSENDAYRLLAELGPDITVEKLAAALEEYRHQVWCEAVNEYVSMDPWVRERMAERAKRG